MSRMPVAERRTQLIEAALRVASREGIDAATVRAVAAEAGVSLGVVHYCFLDKDELLRSVAAAITEMNLANVGTPAAAEDLPTVLESAVENLWSGIRDNRGAQLLSFELTTTSLRHSELNQVAIEQYHGAWAAVEVLLEEIEHRAGIRWLVPYRQLARTVVAVVDGFALAWLVDSDDEAALAGIHSFAAYLTAVAVPASASSTNDNLPGAAVQSEHASMTA